VTGFLNHLAGMALGDVMPGAARVALPPRFAVPQAAPAIPPEEVAPDDPVAVPKLSQPEAPRPWGTTRGPDILNSSVLPGRPVERSAVPTPSVGNVTVNLPRQNAPPATEFVRATIPDLLPKPVAAPRDILPAAKPVTVTRAHPPAAPQALALPRQAPAAKARRDAAPLSKAAVASRVSSAREAPPVIHVTIDRIDVRAPETVKAGAAPKPARRKPTISLGDYLRRGNGGGRA
jgi:hypothetical protein